jgi:hypothetical protein
VTEVATEFRHGWRWPLLAGSPFNGRLVAATAGIPGVNAETYQWFLEQKVARHYGRAGATPGVIS